MIQHERLNRLGQAAIAKFGCEQQLFLVQEECAELIVAISHLARNRQDAALELVEESVDCLIMITQVLKILDSLGIDYRSALEVKLDKLEQLLEGG